MIKIEIQEAEAFDRLSILQVKLNKNLDDLSLKDELSKKIEDLEHCINIYIGYDLAKQVYSSFAYQWLYNINNKLFSMMDHKNPNLNDYTVDNIIIENLNRFAAKQKLQEEFFNNKYQEIKI